MAAYVLVAIGLNLLNGYGGQVSLGHGALVAIGAYTVALAMVDHHWSFWPAALLAMVAAAAVGAVDGAAGLPASTWYFALITLGFAEVVSGLLTEWRELTHGFAGRRRHSQAGGAGPHAVLRSTSTGWRSRSTSWRFVGMANLLRRRASAARWWRARQSRGGDGVWRLAGAHQDDGLRGECRDGGPRGRLVRRPEDGGHAGRFHRRLLDLLPADGGLGGAGRLWGPVVGAVVFFLVPELLAALQSWRMLIYGVALLLLMLYAPHGLVGAIDVGWQRLAHAARPFQHPDSRRRSPQHARPSQPVAGAALSGAGRREAVRRRHGGRRQPRRCGRHHPRASSAPTARARRRCST